MKSLWQIGMLLEAFDRSPKVNYSSSLKDFGVRLFHSLQRDLLFNIELVTCYWALVETEHLIIIYQITIRPMIPFMN